MIQATKAITIDANVNQPIEEDDDENAFSCLR